MAITFTVKNSAKFGYWTPSTSPDPEMNPYWSQGVVEDKYIFDLPDGSSINDAWAYARKVWPELVAQKQRILENGELVPCELTISVG